MMKKLLATVVSLCMLAVLIPFTPVNAATVPWNPDIEVKGTARIGQMITVPQDTTQYYQLNLKKRQDEKGRYIADAGDALLSIAFFIFYIFIFCIFYLESLYAMRYNKQVNTKIFGDGCNSLPAVFVLGIQSMLETCFRKPV